MDTEEAGLAVSCHVVPTLARLAAVAVADVILAGQLPELDAPLPSSYSDEIVDILSKRRQLSSDVFATLSPDRFQITKIDLSGNNVSQNDLRLVSNHTISSFSLGNIDYLPDTNKIQMIEVLSKVFNRKARSALQHLDISGKNRCSSTWPTILNKFPSLVSLSFANRQQPNHTLLMLTASASQLRCLDISNTRITDISPLSLLTNMEVLIMYNLHILQGKPITTLSALRNLRVLDISRKINTDYLQETSQDASVDVPLAVYNVSANALTSGSPSPWPELRSLDVSGQSLGQFGADSAMNFVEKIVEAHPKLEQIGLLATPLDLHASVSSRTGLRVINAATRRSVLDALAHYAHLNRGGFTAHALHSVYYSLQSGYDEFSQTELRDCIELVCLSMQQYLSELTVQIAGSACLYHICKMKRIRRLSVKDVCMCIERSLDAAQKYQSMTQLQKNVWLTICNDYLLHLPGVDFYRTCKVALETMLTNRDASVERMTIAIVSIVTPKMRAPQARSLTADARYVTHLVKIMFEYLTRFQKQQPRDHDNTLYTLKFTLSALWNLTDECAVTCSAFLDAGGLSTAFEILRVFSEHHNVQTKVLGILNNIAEVEDLKLSILCRLGYLDRLIECLNGDFSSRDVRGRHRLVERSYFAAGVLANVLLMPAEDWCGGVSRQQVNDALLNAVMQWPELPSAMVSYRSFDPFCRIMERSKSDGAILWCLWGVHHVLGHRNSQSLTLHSSFGYSDFLRSSELIPICRQLAAERDLISRNTSVVTFAKRICDMVDAEDLSSAL